MYVRGIDLYNQCTTGEVAKTLNAIKSDADHVPCVLIINSSGGDIAGTLDASYYKGQGEREGVEREYIVEFRNAENRGIQGIGTGIGSEDERL